MKILESIFKEYREDVARVILLTLVLVIAYLLIMYGKQLSIMY